MASKQDVWPERHMDIPRCCCGSIKLTSHSRPTRTSSVCGVARKRSTTRLIILFLSWWNIVHLHEHWPRSSICQCFPGSLSSAPRLSSPAPVSAEDTLKLHEIKSPFTPRRRCQRSYPLTLPLLLPLASVFHCLVLRRIYP